MEKEQLEVIVKEIRKVQQIPLNVGRDSLADQKCGLLGLWT